MSSTRTDAIAAFIRSITADAITSDGAKRTASEELQKASAENVSAREVMLGAVASRAHSETWTPNETSEACNVIAKGYNDKKGLQAKAFSTLAGEIKRAAHVSVRGHFDHLQHLRDTVWGVEQANIAAAKAAKEPCPTPCKDAFARAYHMLGKMMTATIEDCAVFRTIEDVQAFVVANDPRLKPDRIAKAVEKLKADVEYLQERMPMQMLTDILEFISAHTPEQIEAQVKAGIEQAKADAEDAATREAMELDELRGDATEEEPNDAAGAAPPQRATVPMSDIDDLIGFHQAA